MVAQSVDSEYRSRVMEPRKQ